MARRQGGHPRKRQAKPLKEQQFALIFASQAGARAADVLKCGLGSTPVTPPAVKDLKRVNA